MGMKNSVWIPLECKDNYLDSENVGIKLRFCDVEIDEELRKGCIRFVRYLRKTFWFPVRCWVHFEYYSYYKKCGITDRNTDAMFYFPKENSQGEILENPSIYIAVSKYKGLLEKYSKPEVYCYYYSAIAHELTHYFQWYFFEDKKRSQRSLEIEANKCADVLVTNYLRSSF